MWKWTCSLVAIWAISGCGGGDSAGVAPSVAVGRFIETAPAPQDGPSHTASAELEYDLGVVPVSSNLTTRAIFLTPVRGSIRYPQMPLAKSGRVNNRYPIVVFLHGNHEVKDPSYRGYDYLATNLAEHGYVAVSIDANAINGAVHPDNPRAGGDASSVSRGQLILATLDRLREIDQSGGPGWQADLQDKLDFERIGVMGHSRGGQGLTNAFKFNLQRESVSEAELVSFLRSRPETFADYPTLQRAVTPTGQINLELFQQAIAAERIFFSPRANSTRPYNFRGGLLLAPTDFMGTVGLANIPLAVVLPSCDGDVINLQGARTFDNNRYSFDYDTAADLQVLVRGANHNYYNTEWREDDTDYKQSGFDAYCDSRRDDTPRLSAPDQRRGGVFLINGFMRYFVGGETAFQGYWNGLAQVPAAACPNGEWPCDARYALTVQKDASERLSVHRFQYSDSLEQNDLGGAVSLSGFDASALCDMPFGWSDEIGTCMPARLPGFDYSPALGTLRSIAEHVELAWSRPGASMRTQLNGISVQKFDSLTLRVAVVRPFGQEIDVTLTDMAGRSATVAASRFSDALYLGPKAPRSGSPLRPDAEDIRFADGYANQLLNMVAIPMAAFEGVDLQRLNELRLTLPGDSGKIALADVQFQNLGRPRH